MDMKSAFNLVPIVEGKDYIVDNKKPSFFAVHCVEENTSDCVIIPFASKGSVTFPPGSFVKGAIYPIVVKKVVKSGGVKFIGYRQNSGTIFG